MLMLSGRHKHMGMNSSPAMFFATAVLVPAEKAVMLRVSVPTAPVVYRPASRDG